MTRTHLLRRSLFFHWRGNLAVLCGVAVGAAVLTGALLVGDSLRGSLRERALGRLGWVEQAMVSGRFVRQQIAEDLIDRDGQWGITLRATAESQVAGTVRRAAGITVWATRGKPAPDSKSVNQIGPGAALISASLAAAVGVKPGDAMTLVVGRHSDVPRESLLGRRSASDTADRLTVTIEGIVAADDPLADFSLAPDVSPPTNVFVSLPWLQEKLGQPERVNVFLANGSPAATLQEQLRGKLTLDDWGLVLRTPASRTNDLFKALDRNNDGSIQPGEWRGRLAESVVESMGADKTAALTRAEVLAYYDKRGTFDLESRQMLIEPAAERAALEAAREVALNAAETFVYLANGIGDGQATIPYSIVAAIGPQPASVGPPLSDDEILLADWTESPLRAKTGDPITVTYFEPELEGRIKEATATFRLRGRVTMTGLAADPDLTPEFPGITDKLDIKDWDPPFPYDNKRIQRRDDEYWAHYRTTPKAYVSRGAAFKLFGSRFGHTTSIRLSLGDADAASKFERALLARLDPTAGGFVFEDVRARALAASTGGQDFGMLFLGFSFFLIAAALVLIGLLVRLNLDRRAPEIGLLFATGFSVRQVRRLMVFEGLWITALGTLVGLGLAIGYAALMLRLLASLWPDGSIGSFLRLHVSGLSLLIGAASTMVVAGLAIVWAVRVLGRVAPSALLGGTIEAGGNRGSGRWPRIAVLVGSVGGVALLVAGHFVRAGEAQAGCFFGGGALLLTAALAAVSIWIKRPERGGLAPASGALVRLGTRNTARNPTRSLLTAGLLAAAAFLLVAVESFRRSPEAGFLERTGGSGGFSLIAESDLPLFQDPASPEGRAELVDRLERHWLQLGLSPADVRRQISEAGTTLETTTVLPLRRQTGDDASCLNLYQPGRPRLVGIPPALIAQGGFAFAGNEGRSAEDKANPWRLLDEPAADGTIPAIGEANTVKWMLKSGLGGTVEVRDGENRPVRLRIVALLHDSVFQGELLVADSAFRRLFPRREGYTGLLIDPAGKDGSARLLFETAYADRGMTVAVAADRLKGYLAVENTYLSTFQVLGGFGLMLGAFGLAAVLLRNVWERRSEFALLRAIGYRRSTLGGLVFIENAVLLLLGLGAGTVAATIAVAPQWLAGTGAAPGWRLAGLLALVVVSGLAAGAIAVRATVRAPLIPALRKE